MLGVDLQVGGAGNWISLKPFPFAERNMFSLSNTQFPMAGQTVRLLYVPQLTLPTQDTDVIDGAEHIHFHHKLHDQFVVASPKHPGRCAVEMVCHACHESAVVTRLSNPAVVEAPDRVVWLLLHSATPSV